MALIAKGSPRADDPPGSKVPCVPAAKIADWLGIMFSGHGGMVEMRAVDVARHSTDTLHAETGLYASDEIGLSRLARDARDVSPRAMGVYCTLNPVMTTVGSGSASDAHVARRRWLLVDVDPGRPAGTSSTDAEKAAARGVADAILDWLRGRGWPGPILADSGNGYHLLYRVDLPNDDASRDLIRRLLEALAGRFNTPGIEVDTTVFNASRICKLYGTLARKGESTDERPHRASRILDVPEDLSVVSRELIAPACGPSASGPSTRRPRRGIIARDLGSDPVEAYGQRALADELGEIRTAAVGNRNNQLFKGAAAIAELVLAGSLDGSALDAVELEGRRAGLTDAEVRRTMKSARDRAKPRDTAHVGGNGKLPVEDGPDGIKENVDDPHRLARIFIDDNYRHPDRPTLCWWDDEWHQWGGHCWQAIAEKDLNARLAAAARDEFVRIAAETGKPAKTVGTRLVGNVALALRSMVLIRKESVSQRPAWVGPGGPAPAECLPTLSGIVHLPTLMDGDPSTPGAIIPPTPRFFSATSLDYEFIAETPKPSRWLEFLHSIWGDDADSIRCLQQWFGYLLTPDTRQQKILLLIGPKRSGKGTITRTLESMIGKANVAAPTLSTLASPFGGQDLINKTVAICPESRLTGRSDSQAIVERLLSISGEDPQAIQRKHMTDWTGYLNTRFVLLGNELPRLGDYSGALPGRMIVLKMEKSFYGKEDLALREHLKAELPGILVWAMAGWKSLREQVRFVQPEAGKELLNEFEELANPMGIFVAERCTLGCEYEVKTQKLYEGWKRWCERNGRERSGDVQGFSRNLKTCIQDVSVAQRQEAGIRFRVFTGIRLNPEDPESY